MRRLPLLLCSFFIAANGAEKAGSALLQNSIEALLASKNYPVSDIGITVRDVEKKKTLAAVSADSMYNPASVSKLLTAAAACEKLGLQYNFATRIFCDTAYPEGNGSAVRNLYIQGGGDPGFTAERLWLLVERLYHCGLRRVTGTVVIDDFLFDSLTVGPGFDEDSGSRAYQPLINALAVNFNCVALHCRPGAAAGDPVVCDPFPEINGLQIQSAATTAAKGAKSTFDCATFPDSSATGTIVTLKGAMKVDEPGSYAFHKLWRTWESFGAALQPLFERRGIRFAGKIVHARLPKRLASRQPFCEFESQPLSIAINDMFKYSSNFTAEMVFKTLSVRRDTMQGSWERSSGLVMDWWKQQGLPGTPVFKNGSGMGNTNRISAAQITALLCHVWEQKTYCPEFIAALSIAGVDGTIKSRFQKSKLKGLVRAKTGTLNDYGVSALAGYLFLPDKGTYAFAIICRKTGHTQYEDWGMQEKILETVAEGVK
jgi:serine-type D-Ala-D-Ala carboxypeptidase/endopeptidase (penicillin-binding protein 4)